MDTSMQTSVARAQSACAATAFPVVVVEESLQPFEIARQALNVAA